MDSEKIEHISLGDNSRAKRRKVKCLGANQWRRGTGAEGKEEFLLTTGAKREESTMKSGSTQRWKGSQSD